MDEANKFAGTPVETAEKKVIEWPSAGNGKWWVVAVTGWDGSYTPLYEAQGADSTARKADAETWLAANHPQ
jgi:hypothetical protein